MGLLLLVLAAALRGEDDPPRPPDLKGTLSGVGTFEKTKGTLRYRNRIDERELEVEVDKISLPTGTVLIVEVNGLRAGTMKVGLLHGADLKLKSKDGDSIPFVLPGTQVVVRTESRTTVVKGRF